MSAGELLQYVVTGLLVGGVYALMSIGLALIFGVMRVVNFAQGDFMMLGMYLTYYLAVSGAVDPLLGALLRVRDGARAGGGGVAVSHAHRCRPGAAGGGG